MKVNSYKDLVVWQKAMDLVMEIYHLSRQFPKEEQYGLTNQIRRAVVSIPSNIAEGRSRHSTPEYMHFLSIAQGSLAETETQIYIAIKLAYINEEQSIKALQLREEISKMLVSIYSKLRFTNQNS
ncbi:MAG TPA: four helix bundle protein [Candidatus Cloacimonadota bacterium]|nr:four helix bundle protein [Candidatus Cloacimonadota bacterium]